MKTTSFVEGNPGVYSFFDSVTNTVTHVVVDDETSACAIIDSVLDYDPNAARISYDSADRVINFVRDKNFSVEWILETHVHADHLSAAPYLQENLGGRLGIGAGISTVQEVFGKVFNFGTEYAKSAEYFDARFVDGEKFFIGNTEVLVMHTPGHTPACVTYVMGDRAFVGDTIFMPDMGSARCDFPGGDARTLYDSVQKIFALGDGVKLFMCHDYLPEGRSEFSWVTTVGEERQKNIHLQDDKSADDFVLMREKRDARLGMPRLIIPSIQVNMHGGELPKPEENGTRYLKFPLGKF